MAGVTFDPTEAYLISPAKPSDSDETYKIEKEKAQLLAQYAILLAYNMPRDGSDIYIFNEMQKKQQCTFYRLNEEQRTTIFELKPEKRLDFINKLPTLLKCLSCPIFDEKEWNLILAELFRTMNQLNEQRKLKRISGPYDTSGGGVMKEAKRAAKLMITYQNQFKLIGPPHNANNNIVVIVKTIIAGTREEIGTVFYVQTTNSFYKRISFDDPHPRKEPRKSRHEGRYFKISIATDTEIARWKDKRNLKWDKQETINKYKEDLQQQIKTFFQNDVVDITEKVTGDNVNEVLAKLKERWPLERRGKQKRNAKLKFYVDKLHDNDNYYLGPLKDLIRSLLIEFWEAREEIIDSDNSPYSPTAPGYPPEFASSDSPDEEAVVAEAAELTDEAASVVGDEESPPKNKKKKMAGAVSSSDEDDNTSESDSDEDSESETYTDSEGEEEAPKSATQDEEVATQDVATQAEESTDEGGEHHYTWNQKLNIGDIIELNTDVWLVPIDHNARHFHLKKGIQQNSPGESLIFVNVNEKNKPSFLRKNKPGHPSIMLSESVDYYQKNGFIQHKQTGAKIDFLFPYRNPMTKYYTIGYGD